MRLLGGASTSLIHAYLPVMQAIVRHRKLDGSSAQETITEADEVLPVTATLVLSSVVVYQQDQIGKLEALREMVARLAEALDRPEPTITFNARSAVAL